MEEKEKRAIVAGIDVFVALFIIIIGFLLTLYGNDWMNLTSQIPSYGTSSIYNPYIMFYKIPWIIIFSGIAMIVYGIKRLIDDITKIR